MHEFNFDTIKVDQAFARGSETNPRSAILMNSIIEMAHLLGADVLVEGVETASMLATLAERNCRYAQGYFIGKPQTLDTVISKLGQQPI